MCDCSLHHAASREAEVGDELVVANFRDSCCLDTYKIRASPRAERCVRSGEWVQAATSSLR